MANVVKHSDPESLKSLIPSLTKLSAGTEMSTYKEAQWEFLVGGGNDVTAYVLSDTTTNDDNNDTLLLGCVLRIRFKKTTNNPSNGNDDEESPPLKEEDTGFGMMLVSPKARGQGFAKKLLQAAMQDEDGDKRRRNILAVCTKLGQPMYQKLGFENVGRVEAMNAKLGDIRESVTMKKSNNVVVVEEEEVTTTIYSYPIDPQIQKLLIDMDKDVTGYDRTDRLSYLLNKSTNVMVGIASSSSRRDATTTETDDKKKNDILVIAAMRQDCLKGTVIVGPMISNDDNQNSTVKKATVSLIQTMAKYHPGDNDLSLSLLLNCDNDDDDSTENLNSLFLNCGASFTKVFDFPAMAKDSKKPIYQKNKNYLALIHPTLG